MSIETPNEYMTNLTNEFNVTIDKLVRLSDGLARCSKVAILHNINGRLDLGVLILDGDNE